MSKPLTEIFAGLFTGDLDPSTHDCLRVVSNRIRLERGQWLWRVEVSKPHWSGVRVFVYNNTAEKWERELV